MIPIENSEWLTFVKTNEDYSAQSSVILLHAITYGGNFRQKWPFYHVLTPPNAINNLGDREIIAGEPSPLRPRKRSDLIQIALFHFYFIPPGASGKLFPQRSIPDEEQGAAFGVFPGSSRCGFITSLRRAPL